MWWVLYNAHYHMQGRDCQLDMNMCRSSPCLNEGTCTNREDSYTCTCPPGLSGHNCGDVDDCTPTSCSVNGTCVVGTLLSTSFITIIAAVI